MNELRLVKAIECDSSICIYKGKLEEFGITIDGCFSEDEMVFELLNWDLPIDASLEELTESFKLSHPEAFI